jgi:hypothetical protein
MAIHLKRQELYQDVWHRPLGYLSRDLGVTAAALREACKAMSIPTPPQGYWAALRAGKMPPSEPLPSHDGPNALTLGSAPRETLSEWVMRTTPGKVAHPADRPSATRTGKAVTPHLVPLRVWAMLLLGEYAPHDNTLLRWVHDGRIVPAAKKIGRRWFVQPDAQYIGD